MNGIELYVERAKLPKADDAEYYHADLIGIAAFSPDGAEIGEIIAVENFGAGDLLEVRRAGRSDSEYIPFTNACVPNIDLAGRRATIVMPVMTGDREPNTEESET